MLPPFIAFALCVCVLFKMLPQSPCNILRLSFIPSFVHRVISEEHREHRQNITGQNNAPRRAPDYPKIWDELTHGQRGDYAIYS